MAKSKIDGVIEAAHYRPDGGLEWVRAYLRRGATYTDRVMLNRQALIDQLKSGKNFYTGKRIPLQASTFQIDKPLRLIQTNGHEVVVTGDLAGSQDRLESVPIL